MHRMVFLDAEVVEHSCNMSTLQMGEFVENVSNGIDTYSIRQPLGVCAGICPFNFPAMIPLWVYKFIVYCVDRAHANLMESELGFYSDVPNRSDLWKHIRLETIRKGSRFVEWHSLFVFSILKD